jgi:glycosyltransferase involved in cell wall biosynthesis
MDIATTSSVSGEAFPVVVAEAMASRTPCVVTDVGDSALIVDKTGSAVAPGDPYALAEAWRKLIEAGPGERQNLGMAARRRVQQHFALPVIVERHQAIYAQVAARTLRGVPASGLSHYAR